MAENSDMTNKPVLSKVSEISEEEKGALRRQTAEVLPDSPAAAGMPASAVKPAFWRGFVGDKYSLVAFFNRMAKEMNVSLDEIATLFDTVLDQLRKKGEALDADIQQLLNDVSAAMLDHDQDIHAHENLLGRSSLVDTIGKVTDHYTVAEDGVGLMTQEQSKNLKTLVDLLSDNDANTTIDTIREVLDAFERTPEGTNIVNALAAKADVAVVNEKIEYLDTRAGELEAAVSEKIEDLDTRAGELEDRIAALEDGSGGDSDKEYYVLMGDHDWTTITADEYEDYDACWDACPECLEILGAEGSLDDANCTCPYCEAPLKYDSEMCVFETRETGSGTGKIYIQGNLDGDEDEDKALRWGLDGLHLVDNYGEENETDITVTEDFLRNKCVFDADSAVYVYTYTNTVFVYDDETEWIINGESNFDAEDEFVYYAPEDVIIKPLY